MQRQGRVRVGRVAALGITIGLGIATFAGVSTGAAAEIGAKSKFCDVQSKIRIDVATLSTNPTKAKKAITAIDRMLKADPPRKVAKALKTIKQAHASLRDGNEPTESLVDSVDTASDTLGEYIAAHCLR